MPFHPRTECEVDQGPLQFRAALDEAGERPLVATLVHGPWCHLTPSPGQARDGSAYDNVSRASRAAREAHSREPPCPIGTLLPPLRFRPRTAASGGELGAPSESPCGRGADASSTAIRRELHASAACMAREPNPILLATEAGTGRVRGIPGC